MIAIYVLMGNHSTRNLFFVVAKRPTIVWARYLLRFLIFRQAFSAKPHIRDHRYCSAYASAGGSLVVIRVNASVVGDKGLEPLHLSILDPKSSASANSANPPDCHGLYLRETHG